MKVKINSVSVEWIAKGKSKYGKATVGYTYNGESRSQNIMSFANPTVFKQVQELEGQDVEVTLTKNAQGYSEWSAVNTEGTSSAPSTSATTRVSGSNYETAEERARKQVYIIKQSSIANAIEIAKSDGIGLSISGVLDIAQQLTDWVLATPSTEE